MQIAILQRVHGNAGHVGKRRVAVDDPSGHGGQADARGVLFEQQAVARLGVAHGLLRGQPRRHIAKAPHPQRYIVQIASDGVLLQAAPVLQLQHVDALHFRMLVQRGQVAQEFGGIGQLIDQVSDQPLIFVLFQQLGRDAPHVGEALVPGEDASLLSDHQNAVGGGVEGRLQQGHRAPRLPLVALPLAQVASDHDRAGDLTVMAHRRMGEGELDGLSQLGAEHVLAIAHPAALQRRLHFVGRNEEFVELPADQVVVRVAEEGAGGVVRELNPSFAIADQQQIAHVADDLLRRERGRDGHHPMTGDGVDGDGGGGEQRRPAERLDGHTVSLKAVNRRHAAGAQGDGEQPDAHPLSAIGRPVPANELCERRNEQPAAKQRIGHARREANARIEAPPVRRHAVDDQIGEQCEHGDLRADQPGQPGDHSAVARGAQDGGDELVDRRRDQRHCGAAGLGPETRYARIGGEMQEGEGSLPHRGGQSNAAHGQRGPREAGDGDDRGKQKHHRRGEGGKDGEGKKWIGRHVDCRRLTSLQRQ